MQAQASKAKAENAKQTKQNQAGKVDGWGGKEKALDDSRIIEMYWQRNENAIAQTADKYGILCHRIARNILSEADAEECVNDAYMRAWEKIPPQRPTHLGAWLGRVVRNLALDRWKCEHAQKRFAGMELLLDELGECIPGNSEMPEEALDAKQLVEHLNKWLSRLDREDRILFVRRYWYGDKVQYMAKARNTSPARLSKRLHQLRQQLKNSLEKEGFRL